MDVIIKGNIFEINCDYICQQCNCITVLPYGYDRAGNPINPHGFSFDIKSKLGVCPYSLRRTIEGRKNIAIETDRPPLGSISIIQSPVKDVKVINMFAQYGFLTPYMYSYKPGSKYYWSGVKHETFEYREDAFFDCLVEMLDMIPKEAVIAFPYKIGCGLAGGNWNNYFKMIQQFAEERNGNVIIVDNS